MYRNSKSTSRLFCVMTNRVLSPSDRRSKISCWRISLSLRDIVRTYPCRSRRQYGHRSSAPQDAYGPPAARPSNIGHRHGGQRLHGPADAFQGRSAEVGLDPSAPRASHTNSVRKSSVRYVLTRSRLGSAYLCRTPILRFSCTLDPRSVQGFVHNYQHQRGRNCDPADIHGKARKRIATTSAVSTPSGAASVTGQPTSRRR